MGSYLSNICLNPLLSKIAQDIVKMLFVSNDRRIS